MTLRLGIAGLGPWGLILARAFASLERCQVRWLCDTDPAARTRAAASLPGASLTDDFDALLADPALDAVALATPSSSHAELATRALQAGKHCFVEKPLARTVADARTVIAAAQAADRVLMVGHVLDYHPAVTRLREIIEAGELGDVRYIHSSRLNLATPGGDENALWALGAHDVSVALALVGEEPSEVEARGAGYASERVEEVVFAFLRFRQACERNCTAPG